VVYTAAGKIEVLSSRTGRLIRTLATGVALYRGPVSLAVSPAEMVYFDDARGAGQWIRRVPLAGGPVTTIAAGDSPAISPDGRLPAYVTYTDRTGKPAAIVVRDLSAGTQKTWAFTSALPGINNLSWLSCTGRPPTPRRSRSRRRPTGRTGRRSTPPPPERAAPRPSTSQGPAGTSGCTVRNGRYR
jgi:hypothetical protein